MCTSSLGLSLVCGVCWTEQLYNIVFVAVSEGWKYRVHKCARDKQNLPEEGERGAGHRQSSPPEHELGMWFNTGESEI